MQLEAGGGGGGGGGALPRALKPPNQGVLSESEGGGWGQLGLLLEERLAGRLTLKHEIARWRDFLNFSPLLLLLVSLTDSSLALPSHSNCS